MALALTDYELAEQDRLSRYRSELEAFKDDAVALLAGRNPSDLPDKDVAELEKISDEMEKIRARIGTLERLTPTLAQMSKADNPNAGQRRTAFGDGSNQELLTRNAAAMAIRGYGQAGGESKAAQMFGPPKPDPRYPTLGAFCRDVHFEPGKLARMAMETGSGTGGGYAIPSHLGFGLFDQMYASGLVWPLCKLVPLTGSSISIWGFNANTAASNTLYGAVSIFWKGEGATASPQNPKLRQVNLRANKIFLLTQTTSELLQDAGTGFETELGTALKNAGSWALDEAVINGTGAGMPLGLLNSPCKIAVPKVTSQTADTINSTNIFAMWSRLHPLCSRNAVWLANPNCLPALFSMVVGGTSSDVPVFLPMGQSPYSALAGSPAMTLLGRPLILTDHCKTLGDEGDIILFDPTQYALGMRKDFGIESSIHANFSSDIVDWRMICRVGGECLWDQVYTPARGATLSCIVTLAERA